METRSFHCQAPATPNYQSLDRPLDFTSRRRRQGARADRRGRQSRAEAARLYPGRRLFGLPVRIRVRRATGPKTTWPWQPIGVTLLVDPLSLQYLMGAEVDYTESLHGAQFVIRNPNAKTTCGCGSSFTV